MGGLGRRIIDVVVKHAAAGLGAAINDVPAPDWRAPPHEHGACSSRRSMGRGESSPPIRRPTDDF
jgi:hypothetical protein